MAKVRLLPSEVRRRGLPAVGFELIYGGDGVEAEPAATSSTAVAAIAEHRDGARIGALTIEISRASLVIDRDGALARLVQDRAPLEVPCRITLDAGATGFRISAFDRDRLLPYRTWFSLAPADVGGNGALIVSVESTRLEWPAGAAMLASLRVFCRDADARAQSQSGDGLTALPLVKPSGS